MIKALIYVKTGDDGEPKPLGGIHYEFEEEELDRLINDFERYITEGEPLCGTYQCTVMGAPRKLSLQFIRVDHIG